MNTLLHYSLIGQLDRQKRKFHIVINWSNESNLNQIHTRGMGGGIVGEVCNSAHVMLTVLHHHILKIHAHLSCIPS